MATQNTVNIGINVSDNGTSKKVIKSFQEVEAAAAKAQRAAQGTQGSRAAYAKSAPSGSQTMSGEMYGNLRGSAGATGASARDFANQAQGLGGLVRLYATYAANLFAVGAAFTALKSAADTTNLVKGLNTLGAVSGKSLGSLSKRLVEVTDGAVSMREAMEATAKASSAGMSSKDIERLGLVAKNASLALGVAMPDALSRISRGIVKLEPELLDELGLFTKIGPATEKYALEIGKSASALSDFERRQAFANAVLEEGEKKFGALAEAAANPYDKLLSSLKNILSSGGELINKVLTPIISLLANSPTALSAVLVGIGYVLLKQAVPAIGQLRAGLRATAEEALKSAEAFKESFGDQFQTILERRFKIPDLEAGVKKAQADLAKLKVPTNIAGSVKALAEGDSTSLKKVEAVLARKNALVETGMRGTKQASEAQIAAAKQEILYINGVINVLKKKQALELGTRAEQGQADKPMGPLDPEILALKKYDQLRGKVDKANAISNAAQVASIAGVRASWDLLNKEVADKGLKGFAKYSTLAQGGLAAIGTRVMGVVSAFSWVGQAIAIATAAFIMLDGWFTKNAKQVEKFNSALTTAQESVDNVTRTISAATSLEGFATSTIANTVAFSNALNELSGSLTELIKLSREADRAAGNWDNFWDSVFAIADRDRASKLAKSVAGQIQSSIKLLSREGLAEEYNNELKKILQVDDLQDFNKVAEAFKNLSTAQQDAVIAIQNNSNRALGNASADLQSFKEKTEEAVKAQKTLSNSFLDSSPAFKYGESLLAVSSSLSSILAQGPERVSQALQEVSTNLQKGALFGKEFVSEFGKISSQFQAQKTSIDASKGALIKYREELAKAQKNLQQVSAVAGPGSERFKTAKEASDVASENVRLLSKALANMPRDFIDRANKLVANAATATFDKGMSFINKAIRDAQNAAAITIGKVLTSNLTGPQKLQADAAYAQREIKAKLADIQISEDMLDTQSQLVNEMKLANALQSEANILQKANSTQTEKDAASKAVAVARGNLGDLSGLEPDEVRKLEADAARAKTLKSAGLQAARVAATGQLTASQLSLKGDLPLAQAQQEEELKKITDKTTASLAARQDIMSGIASVTSAEVLKNKQSSELAEKSIQQNRELEAINDKIAQSESKRRDAASRNDGDAQKYQQEQLKFLEQVKLRTKQAQAADTSLITAKHKQELLATELTDLDRRYEVLRSESALETQAAVSRLDSQNQLLTLQAQTNGYSQEYVIARQTAIEKEKLLLDTSIAMQQAQDALTQKREAAEIRLNALRKDGADKNKALIDAETAELVRQETLTNNTITGLSNQFNSKTAILDKTKEINTEQARYNDLLNSSSDFATALGDAFGEVGNKLGGIVSSLTQLAVSSEKSAKALADLEFERDAANDSEKRKKIEKEIASQVTKNAKNEMSLQAKLAGQAKTLFKEKTVAYKVLNGLEKIRSNQALALSFKEFAIKSGLLKQEQIDEMAAAAKSLALKASTALKSIGIDIPAIYAKFMSIMGPFGAPAAAAAIAAFVGGAFGGGGSKSTFIPNAEQRQETQGTAMGYDSEGNKVQVRRGVFGDTEAKSESIANSLELIRETSVDGLSYDNKMVTLLTSIDSGINKTAKGLYSIEGLRSGSMFGTVTGTQSGGGLLGTGFLGSKTSRNITDSGLIIEGTFGQLASDTNKAVIDFFEQVTVTKKSWYGKTRSWVETKRQEIDDATSEFFKDIFGNATSLFIEVGSKAGIDASAVKSILNNLDVGKEFASLRGLKGEEFQQELSAIIGTILDDASLAIFSSFEQYADFGEGMLETVIRVVDTNEKINQAVKNLGLTVDLTKLYGVTEALAEAAGGLEEFLDQSRYFAENFLTEAERVAPIQKAVVERLAQLGYASVDTKAEFVALVKSLDLTSESGISTYQSLMDLAPGFHTVIEAVEDQSQALKDAAQGFRDFIQQIKDFKASLLLGASSTLTPQQKYVQAKAEFENVYAQALAGDSVAMGKVTSSAQSFLDASKTYFASSTAYTNDFNTVLSKLDTASISAEASASVADLQLSQLSIQTTLLSDISSNIALIAGVPQAARGGRVSGLTLVGEMGPELVDFTYPGQVYPADQTRGMFAPQSSVSNNMSQVVQELRQVKQELAQLRKEQQQQTGDLIIANYDANNRTAEAVTTEVANAATSKEWQQRNKVAVV